MAQNIFKNAWIVNVVMFFLLLISTSGHSVLLSSCSSSWAHWKSKQQMWKMKKIFVILWNLFRREWELLTSHFKPVRWKKLIVAVPASKSYRKVTINPGKFIKLNRKSWVKWIQMNSLQMNTKLLEINFSSILFAYLMSKSVIRNKFLFFYF